MVRSMAFGVLVALTVLARAAPAAAAQYSIVYNFRGGTDGRSPGSPPGADSAGQLYLEALGGAYGDGAVFRLMPPSAPGEPWSDADIYDFHSAAPRLFCGDGSLTVDAGGNIYGTGTQSCGYTTAQGVAYRLTPTPQVYQMTDLYASASRYPYSGLQFGADGLLYSSGRDFSDDAGLLLRVPNLPGPPQVRPLANAPPSALSAPAGGRFFFTTSTGGDNNLGTAEMLTTSAGGRPLLSIIYSFEGGTNVSSPYGYAPVAAPDHNIYGCGQGGTNGKGAVFQLVRPAAGQTSWTETVIYNFTSADTQEASLCALSAGPTGGLIGVLTQGGRDEQGTVFSLAPPSATSGSAWTYSVLHSFNPRAGDLFSIAGAPVRVGNSYFGTASLGGNTGLGGVYEITP